jgi:hypothetical protein
MAPAGRPKKPKEQVREEIIRVRATKSEAAKFRRLGGAAWLRRLIKEAKEP